MWFRLTIALGHKSVRECQQCIDSAEFAEWLAYYSIEPFGYPMDNLRFGAVVAAIYNVNRKKGATAIKANEVFQARKPISDWQDQLKLVEILNEAFGGKDLRGDKKTSSA